MNEQIQTWLAATLEKLTTVAGQVADFASGELPLFVKEFLLFHALWSWSMCILGIVILVIVRTTIPILHRKTKHWDTCDRIPVVYILYGGMLGSIGFVVFLVNLYWALMITLAPRVYLVHEFVRFFQPGN